MAKKSKFYAIDTGKLNFIYGIDLKGLDLFDKCGPVILKITENFSKWWSVLVYPGSIFWPTSLTIREKSNLRNNFGIGYLAIRKENDREKS
ncbi:hypothetical protein [Arachidicoccus sp.]|uniref:hypothetical protein n=1 Tax=Arachidicoccus sp. TaxID=1872624 RepID=UPI003D1D9734